MSDARNTQPQTQAARRVENEYMFRNMNERYARALADHMSGEQFEAEPLDFCCECSDPTCLERINVSAKQFHDVHHEANQFIVRNGHEQLDIEDVVAQEYGYTVVQKHGEVRPKKG